MSDNCQLVVFSNKAYNAIIRESFDKDPVETGGILLGHILDNGVWIVMEVLPPGINSIFQYAYFEYDEAFVNYLAQSVANQYKRPLDLLGLWHRHPGDMDFFSNTDDGTNLTFARQNPAGVISGLVNIDPNFRITMYHLDHPTGKMLGRPKYSVVDVEVGDDIIPEEYFQLRYFDGEDSNLHPTVRRRAKNFQPRQIASNKNELANSNYEQEETGDNNISTLPEDEHDSHSKRAKNVWQPAIMGAAAGIIALLLIMSSIKYGKIGYDKLFNDGEQQQGDTHHPTLSKTSITLKVGKSEKIEINDPPEEAKIKWESSNEKIAIVDKNGNVTAVKEGKTNVSAYNDGKLIEKAEVNVSAESNPNKVAFKKDKNGKDKDNGWVYVNESIHFINEPRLEITGEPVLKYSSSDPKVAKVFDDGGVKGLSKGDVIITISWDGGEHLEYKLKVK